MKKPAPKKIEDIFIRSNPKLLLAFCKKIKGEEVYDKEQMAEYLKVSAQALRRWIFESEEIKKYVCHVPKGSTTTTIFVSPKFKKELLQSGKAIEGHYKNG